MNLNLIELVALALLVASILLTMIRVLMGPASMDRVIAADTMAVTITAALGGVAAVFGNILFLDIALVYAALAFIATVALAKALQSGAP